MHLPVQKAHLAQSYVSTKYTLETAEAMTPLSKSNSSWLYHRQNQNDGKNQFEESQLSILQTMPAPLERNLIKNQSKAKDCSN